jgi:hypothetical protein
VITTVNTTKVANTPDGGANSTSTTSHIGPGKGPVKGNATSPDPISNTIKTTCTWENTTIKVDVENDGTDTTTTTTTVSTATTTAETATFTQFQDKARVTVSDDSEYTTTVTVQDDNVDGDPDTTRTTVTTTSLMIFTCPYLASEVSLSSRSAKAKMIGYQSPRHFLRLFLRDGRNSWRKPDEYHERFEECFSTPADKQFLPALDFDPTVTTSNTGGEVHG